jgi:hypothetical protein
MEARQAESRARLRHEYPTRIEFEAPELVESGTLVR